jgi:hypothetical protein
MEIQFVNAYEMLFNLIKFDRLIHRLISLTTIHNFSYQYPVTLNSKHICKYCRISATFTQKQQRYKIQHILNIHGCHKTQPGKVGSTAKND